MSWASSSVQFIACSRSDRLPLLGIRSMGHRSAELTAPRVQPSRGRSIGRFSLRTLFVAVTVAACVSAYYAFFRSAEATVTYEFRTVSLVARSGKPESLHPKQRARIRGWPRQAVSWSFIQPVFLDVKDPRQGAHPAKLPAYKSVFCNLCLELGSNAWLSCSVASAGFVNLGDIRYHSDPAMPHSSPTSTQVVGLGQV